MWAHEQEKNHDDEVRYQDVERIDDRREGCEISHEQSHGGAQAAQGERQPRLLVGAQPGVPERRDRAQEVRRHDHNSRDSRRLQQAPEPQRQTSAEQTGDVQPTEDALAMLVTQQYHQPARERIAER